jgi:hypothetical protein
MSSKTASWFFTNVPELNGLSRVIMSRRVARASAAPVQSRVRFFLSCHHAGGSLHRSWQ